MKFWVSKGDFMKLIVALFLVLGLFTAGCARTESKKPSKEDTPQTQGLNFAREYLTEAGKSWNLDDVSVRMDPSIKEENYKNDFKGIFALYKNNLGSLKEIKSGKEVEFKINPDPESAKKTLECAGAYHFEFSTEKEKNAEADLTVYRAGGKWYLKSININSPNIKETIGAGNEKALALASDLALKTCKTWNLEALKSHVTESLRQEMNDKAGKAMKETMAILKEQLGNGQKIEKTEMGSSNLKGGSFHYINVVTVTCENGSVEATFLIVDKNGNWLVEGFAFNPVKK